MAFTFSFYVISIVIGFTTHISIAIITTLFAPFRFNAWSVRQRCVAISFLGQLSQKLKGCPLDINALVVVKGKQFSKHLALFITDFLQILQELISELNQVSITLL